MGYDQSRDFAIMRDIYTYLRKTNLSPNLTLPILYANAIEYDQHDDHLYPGGIWVPSDRQEGEVFGQGVFWYHIAIVAH